MLLAKDGLRIASALMLMVALALSGCAELNQWEGPSENPMFSVDDEIPAGWDPAGAEAKDRDSDAIELDGR
jgi:hypothetical protein